MTPIQFCYWLQGYFELRRANNRGDFGLNIEQVLTIETHVQKIFNQTPNVETKQESVPKDKPTYPITWSSKKSAWIDARGEIYPNQNSKSLDDWNHFYGS